MESLVLSMNTLWVWKLIFYMYLIFCLQQIKMKERANLKEGIFKFAHGG